MTGISKDCIESAYCFFHQKLRVYEYSTSLTQNDDIEYAINQYVDGMCSELYVKISEGRENYLLDHTRFEEDMRDAIEKLDKLLSK